MLARKNAMYRIEEIVIVRSLMGVKCQILCLKASTRGYAREMTVHICNMMLNALTEVDCSRLREGSNLKKRVALYSFACKPNMFRSKEDKMNTIYIYIFIYLLIKSFEK